MVPPLAQRIHEDPNELDDLRQVVVQRIVGAPSAELAAWVKEKICRTPRIDYPWPGNVKELEQCVRRILLKHVYTPLVPHSPSDLSSRLQTGIQQQDLTTTALVAGYCLTRFQTHKTIEAVARTTGLDRRTAKKHIQTGQHLFASENH